MHDSIYPIIFEVTSTEMDNRILVTRGAEGGGDRKDVSMTIKGQHDGFLHNGGALYFDCINANILVVQVSYSFARSYQWL